MNSSESGNHNETLIQYWLEKARESLDSADSDYQAGRLSPAVRSIYYACFYALSAVMLCEGKTFRKHTAIRGALHRDLIRTLQINLPLSTVICCYLMDSEGADLVKTTLYGS
ncbi:MAG: HEPN domain-containing protein [Desulfobacteraceae bacterium]|nr:HEPN domain-containing protein [Desulfobacteraceae bacterium]